MDTTFTQSVEANADDEMIQKLLAVTFVNRPPTRRERNLYYRWRNWEISDELLFEAAKRSVGTDKPFLYMNVILASWKVNNVEKLADIPDLKTRLKKENLSDSKIKPKKIDKALTFSNERHYTKADYDNFFTNIDDIDF